MSFFGGTGNVQITGGEFNFVNGDYTVVNGSRHTSNINSFNTINNTAVNSFNTNSEYQGGHLTAESQQAGNSSDNASQRDSNGNGLIIGPMDERAEREFDKIISREFPSANSDNRSESDVSDSEGDETPVPLPTNMMDNKQGPAQLSNLQPSNVGQAPPFYQSASSQSTQGNQDIIKIFGGPAVSSQGASGATFTTVNGSLTRYDYRQNVTNINSGNVENNYYQDSHNTTATERHKTSRQRKLGKNLRRGA